MKILSSHDEILLPAAHKAVRDGLWESIREFNYPAAQEPYTI